MREDKNNDNQDPAPQVNLYRFLARMPIGSQPGDEHVTWEPCSILARDAQHAAEMCSETGLVLVTRRDESPSAGNEGGAQ